MKKFVTFLLVVVMLFSMVACSNTQTPQTNESQDPSNTLPPKTTEDQYEKNNLVITDRDGRPGINSDLFGNLIERVELTLENWKNYICVVSYDVTTVIKDAFDEIISTITETKYCLGATTDRYHSFGFLSTAIELKHKETGEIQIIEFDYYGQYVDSEFDLNDYDCTRIKGHLYFLDLPEEVIYGEEGSNIGFFFVGNSNWASQYTVDLNSKAINIDRLDNYLE